jgi:hypothetical protein
LGRTSPASAWLAALGARPPEIASSDARLIYFSRHFRFRPGRRCPDGKWLLSQRGDLGYAGFEHRHAIEERGSPRRPAEDLGVAQRGGPGGDEHADEP